jgi:RAD51-like protein 2
MEPSAGAPYVDQHVGPLVLPQALRAKLLARGYLTTSSVSSVTPEQLALDCSIPVADARHISALASRPPCQSLLAGARTAAEMLAEETQSTSISTLCRELDIALNGGVRRGDLTEVCGEPGVGKTQLAMQLSLDVQIPREMGGVGGEALYIDTEGSFSVVRSPRPPRTPTASGRA